MRGFAIFAFAVVVAGLPARAQDNPACARFEEPLAYNACLARQGPTARATRGIPEPRGVVPRYRGSPAVTRTAKGRVHAVFTIR
jgi:hypothetical protein